MLIASTAAAQNFAVIRNLENQNVGQCEYDSASNTITFEPYVDSVNTCAVWFNFGVTGYRMDTVLTFKSKFKATVHRPTYPAISNDNTTFTLHKQNGKHSDLNLQIKPQNDTTYIATGHPYTYTRLNNFLNSHDNPSVMSSETIMTTKNGLDVKLLTITKSKRGKKKLIWIICRQHAFESVGNYVMEGMLRYLLSDSCSKKLLKNHIFKIVPMVDVESVVNGQSGRMSLPVDYNRDWENPKRTVIRLIEDEIKSTAQKHDYKIFWDIHGTFPGGAPNGNFSYFDLNSTPSKHGNILDYWHKYATISGYMPIPISDNLNKYDGMTADWWNEINYGSSLLFSSTLEIDWAISPKKHEYTPADYITIGKMMIQALE